MSTGVEVARRPVGALSVTETQADWTPDQKAALAHLGIGDDVKTADLKVFLTYAQRTGLDPFARQIYLIGRASNRNVNGRWISETKYTIQTGIDGFRVIAARTGKYRGQVAPQWCSVDGIWRDVWLSPEPPAACRIGVLHAEHDAPLFAVALLAEFMPTKEDRKTGEVKATGLWARMPAHMLAKCAEALALRQAFPNDLSGMYTTDEMMQAQPATSELPGLSLTAEQGVSLALSATTADDLRELWRRAADAKVIDDLIDHPESGDRMTLRDLITLRVARVEADTVHQAEPVISADQGPDPQPSSDDWPATAQPADVVDAETVPD